MKNSLLFKKYIGKKILITGGLGFIGSNIAQRLIELGAKVTIIDNLNPLYGGNLFNIDNIKNKVKVIIGDVRDQKLIEKNVINKDIIFDLAAQVSHADSKNMPFEDLDINCKAHLLLLETCRRKNDKVKILFASSRLVLGKIMENPVTIYHPTNPLSLYGIHKLTTEKYFQLYHNRYGIPTTILRLTNPYGERQQIKHGKYSIPGWFLRLAMEKKSIKIFGDGKQLRDYIYVDDVVLAFLLTGITNKTNGKIYNCGLGKSIKFKKMAEFVVSIVGNGKIEYVPWPKNYAKEETGSFETDISELKKDTGWKPKIELKEGIRKMFKYYKLHSKKYVSNK